MIATAYAKGVSATIQNMSGLYVASDHGGLWSNTSSSSDSFESEAHLLLDTTDANTGIGAGDTINSFKLVLNISGYDNPNLSTFWGLYWGTGAGATIDVGDWRVDSGNEVLFDPGGVNSAYEIPLIGAFVKSSNFHIRIKTLASESPASGIVMLYTAGVTPKLVIDYTPAVSAADIPKMLTLGVG